MKKLKDDLKVVTRELKKIVRKVEVLSNRADSLEKKQVADAKKAKAKRTVAKNTAAPKTTVRKTASKRPVRKKIIRKK